VTTSKTAIATMATSVIRYDDTSAVTTCKNDYLLEYRYVE
jgi:hypothetical protein